MRIKRDSLISKRRGHSKRAVGIIVLIILSLSMFYLSTLFLSSSSEHQRDELMARLGQRRELAETNERLKTELAGVTYAGYLEYKAKERLGLKKAKEEEVYVLR